MLAIAGNIAVAGDYLSDSEIYSSLDLSLLNSFLPLLDRSQVQQPLELSENLTTLGTSANLSDAIPKLDQANSLL